MSVPSTGPIRASDINTLAGRQGGAQVRWSQLLLGGVFFPNGISENAAIPSTTAPGVSLKARRGARHITSYNIVPQYNWNTSSPSPGVMYGGAFMEYVSTATVQLNMTQSASAGVVYNATLPTQWTQRSNFTNITDWNSTASAFAVYAFFYETRNYATPAVRPVAQAGMLGYSVKITGSPTGVTTVEILRDGQSVASAPMGFEWNTTQHVGYIITYNNGTITVMTGGPGASPTPTLRLTYVDPNPTAITNRAGATFHGMHRFNDGSNRFLGPSMRANYPLVWRSGTS